MSNASSVDDEEGREGSRSSRHSRLSTSVNLKNAVALMEEGTSPASSPLESTGEGSGRTYTSSRSGRASHYMNSGRKSSLRPSMRIIVDPANETVTEMDASDAELQGKGTLTSQLPR